MVSSPRWHPPGVAFLRLSEPSASKAAAVSAKSAKATPPTHNSRHAHGRTLRSRGAVSLGLTMQGRTPPSTKTEPIMAAGAAMPPPPPPAAGNPAAGVSPLWLSLFYKLGEEEKDTNPPPAGVQRRVRRIDTRSIRQRPAMRLGEEVRLTSFFM